MTFDLKVNAVQSMLNKIDQDQQKRHERVSERVTNLREDTVITDEKVKEI